MLPMARWATEWQIAEAHSRGSRRGAGEVEKELIHTLVGRGGSYHEEERGVEREYTHSA
jgi:hypothetical protein